MDAIWHLLQFSICQMILFSEGRLNSVMSLLQGKGDDEDCVCPLYWSAFSSCLSWVVVLVILFLSTRNSMQWNLFNLSKNKSAPCTVGADCEFIENLEPASLFFFKWFHTESYQGLTRLTYSVKVKGAVGVSSCWWLGSLGLLHFKHAKLKHEQTITFYAIGTDFPLTCTHVNQKLFHWS